MTDNIYQIDQLVTNGQSLTLTDDGSGSDWLVLDGNYKSATDIRLSWWSENGVSTQASGLYYTGVNTGSRLVVNGLIENVRGCDSADFIQGNEAANILIGEAEDSIPGGNDTIWGGGGNDIILGLNGNDELSGDDGDDLLFGGEGRDKISGNAGVDTIEGGTGADTLSGGANAGDILSYSQSAAGVSVSFTYGSTTTGKGGDAQGDKINGFSDIVGSAYNDTLRDTVKGTIAFGYNDNTFAGGAGNDRLTLGGGNDAGYGEKGNDTLAGGAGNDTLNGGSGKDLLNGGIGKDKLMGGTGGDHFVFKSVSDSTNAASGRDFIQDFSHRQHDKIDLSAVDANGAARHNGTFDFIGTDRFSDTAGELRYAPQKNDAHGFRVFGDINGDGKADFTLVLHGDDLTTLRAGDFIL